MTELRVVVCDDTPSVRHLMTVVLAEQGVTVVAEVGNGEEAIDAVERLSPDVILLDLAMPIMDGLEAIPLIKGANPSTKIVVMSAFDGGMVQSAIEAGADAYLSKEHALRDLGGILQGLRPAQPQN